MWLKCQLDMGAVQRFRQKTFGAAGTRWDSMRTLHQRVPNRKWVGQSDAPSEEWDQSEPVLLFRWSCCWAQSPWRRSLWVQLQKTNPADCWAQLRPTGSQFNCLAASDWIMSDADCGTRAAPATHHWGWKNRPDPLKPAIHCVIWTIL